MTTAKTTDVDYMHFLIAEFCAFSYFEAERCSKYSSKSPYHDSFRRLLEESIPHNTEALWNDVSPLVSRDGGYLKLMTLLWIKLMPAPCI